MAYYSRRRPYKGTGTRRFDMPGSFGGARAPDVLYSWSDWNFSTGEFMFNRTDATGANIVPAVSIDPMTLHAGTCFQTAGPSGVPSFYAVNLNDPRQPYIACPQVTDASGPPPTSYQSVIASSTNNQAQSAGAMNLNMWAPVYRQMAIYKTKVMIEFTPAYVDPNATSQAQVDDLAADKLFIYFMLPNRQFGDATNPRISTGASTIMNPFAWSNNMATNGPTTIRLNRNVRRIPLTSPNTIGGGTTLKATWSLRNQMERNVNYMFKNILTSNGTAWGAPEEIAGNFNAPTAAPGYFFYFGLGTDMGAATFTYRSKFRVRVRFYYKCWQIRDNTASWINLVNEALTARYAKALVAPNKPVQDEDYMETDDQDDYDSVPSTPVIEQLTRELSMFGNAKKVQSVSSKKA